MVAEVAHGWLWVLWVLWVKTSIDRIEKESPHSRQWTTSTSRSCHSHELSLDRCTRRKQMNLHGGIREHIAP
jgi:hypothetical protein